MNLCLLSDPWIPVRRNGETAVIRPDQIAEPDVKALAWSRPDFNLACIELLIGLISMADPPENDADWRQRLDRPDAGRLSEALAPFAPHFSLAGDGPRFLQDFEHFENDEKAKTLGVDVLYIDSAGEQTKKNNADVMVKRNRFDSLSLAEAAIALYTLQAFAPSGGAGNRTSMRGGGPMITLVHPLDEESACFPLWRLVFANVLPGHPLPADDATNALPWLRPTRTSKNGQGVVCKDTNRLEAFFGMPRRLRLAIEDGRVVGVVQKPHGTNYETSTWEHPLTPYYRPKEDDPQWLPVHPKAGRLSYRNWLGITMMPTSKDNTRRAAKTVRDCSVRSQSPDFELLVGGWVMDKMTPVSFSLDTYPGFPGLDEEGQERIHQLVEAAKTAANALGRALREACELQGTSVDIALEAFFADTEDEFRLSVREIMDGTDTHIMEKWHKTLRTHAVGVFDQRVVGGLAEHSIKGIEKRLVARGKLHSILRRRAHADRRLPVPGENEQQA